MIQATRRFIGLMQLDVQQRVLRAERQNVRDALHDTLDPAYCYRVIGQLNTMLDQLTIVKEDLLKEPEPKLHWWDRVFIAIYRWATQGRYDS